MEEMKWSSSGLLGLCVLAANNLGFALALAEICLTLWPATEPHTAFHNMVTSLIDPFGEMKWSSSGLLGLCVLAANNLGFVLAPDEICQTFGR
jgi:hypothetical protein